MSRILHLGLGSFHRAHLAWYMQRLNDLGANDWTLAGGNIRPDMSEVLDALIDQHGEYTLETIDLDGEPRYERVTAIDEIVPYEPLLAGLIELGARSDTRIISFTVTEAGYYLNGDQLDPSHTDIQGDITQGTCNTLYGAITAIIEERARRDSGPVTLMSCDNLRGNGTRFRAALLDFLQRRGAASTSAWILANTTCPNAMVDRITPRPSSDVMTRVRAATGWNDRAPVMSERFAHWAIEDDFAEGRPRWERVGAELVESVVPHEEAKIRLLNATHSCIAWAGALVGLRYIHEAVQVPAIREMAYEYSLEAIAALSPSPIDLGAYRDVVLNRFANAHLRDDIGRVAMDGYSKVPGFILPTIRERVSRGESIARTAMLPALFFNFLGRWRRHKLDFSYQDGAMDAIKVHAIFMSPDPLAAFCRDETLWESLAGSPELTAAIRIADLDVQMFVEANTPPRAENDSRSLL